MFTIHVGAGPGGAGVWTPPFSPRCRLFKNGPKAGTPPPFLFVCRRQLDPPPFKNPASAPDIVASTLRGTVSVRGDVVHHIWVYTLYITWDVSVRGDVIRHIWVYTLYITWDVSVRGDVVHHIWVYILYITWDGQCTA